MIVSTELFPGVATSQNSMNCGLQQFDPRYFSAPPHWLPQPQLSTLIKSEARDDGFSQYLKDDNSYSGPLTPPGGGYAGNGYNTPPRTQPEYGSSPPPGQPACGPTILNTPRPGTPQARPPSAHSPHDEERQGSDSNLTPPGSAPSPPIDLDSHGIAPALDSSEGSSKSDHEQYDNGDSLKRLQIALQRNGMIPEEKLNCPMCDFSCSVRSTFNEHLLAHETKCTMCDYTGETSEKLREHLRTAHDQVLSEEDWGDDEPGLTTPKVNSQGKVKTFKCKQCEFSAVTKLEFWEHSRSHIKRDRILTCPKCPFVTEYKHHLEYHLRNHYGSKPFKCDKCSYSCVNKSMLNSHLKSHSNVYQFRCSDCTYATKYCHSLKLHLRKYGHNPAMVLNPDGSPNPLPIVDVYGTRRGPKQKSGKGSSQPKDPEAKASTQTSPLPMFNPYNLLPTQMPYYNILNGFSSFPFSQDGTEEKNNNINKDEEEPEETEVPEEKEEKYPLDLSCPEPQDSNPESEAPAHKNRRKGKAFKLERVVMDGPGDEEEPAEEEETPQPMELVVAECRFPKSPPEQAPPEPEDSSQSSQPPKEEYNCTFCDISFKDIVMYTMHMGYHGYQDPFTCNMCGQHTTDKLSFFLHIARTPHS